MRIFAEKTQKKRYKQMKKSIVLLIFTVIVTYFGFAQEIPDKLGGDLRKSFGNGNKDDSEQMDSLGYNVPSVIKVWRLTNNFTSKKTVVLDTVLGNLQNYNPIYQQSISNSYLGNIGSANISNIYIDRDSRNSFLFFRPYSAYLKQPENIAFYNTTTPYTVLFYETGGSKGRDENYLKVLHTQNIKPYWNAGVQYNLISSYGSYQNQKTKVYDFTLFSSYKKQRVALDFIINSNRLTLKENGGLKADSLLADKSEKSENLQTSLSGAFSKLGNFNLFVNGKYGFGKEKQIVSEQDTVYSYPMDVQYTFNYQVNSWQYRDNDLTADFYNQNLLSSLSTFDKVDEKVLRNTFQVIFNENENKWIRLGARLGAVSEICNYRLRRQMNKYTWKQQPEDIHNTMLLASLFSQSGKSLNWQAVGTYIFEGYAQNDFKLSGDITKWIGDKKQQNGFRAEGKLEAKKPNFLFEEYYGNHQIWKNSFDKVIELQAKGEYFNKKYKFRIGAGINQIENYVYFGLDTLPHQANSGVTVLTAYADKDFRLGNFYFNQKLVAQKSSSDNILPLPRFSVYSNNYYKNTFFKGALGFQAGVSLHYNTAFNAPAYMPATGQFYLQNRKEIGDYPKLNVYVNLRIRRTRLFFMYEHINSSFGNRDYFSAYHYPIAPGMFKYGLIWTFYN